MGQITIQIPQNIYRNYRIESADVAEKLLLHLEVLIKNAEAEEIGDKQATDEE